MSWEIGNPIPDDWQEEADGWAVGLFLFPNSDKWGFVTRTVLRVLSRGRFWARDSGSIVDAQDAGRLAYMSFTYVSFQSLLDAINGLAAAIDSQTTQVTVDGLCCDQVTSPSPPDPPPSPMPPGSVLDPSEVPPLYESIEAYRDEMCTYANALHYQVAKFLGFLTTLDTVAAIITVVVALLALTFPEPATTAIGGVTLATIVGVLLTVEGGLGAVALWAEDAGPYWNDQQQTFVCFLYDVMFSSESWKDDTAEWIAASLNQVSETFPAPVVKRMVSWVQPFLSWMERDLYDRLGTLEPSPTPVNCAGCGALPCDTFYPGVSSCVVADYFDSPAPESVSLTADPDVVAFWEYGGGILNVEFSAEGSTSPSTPGISFAFPVDPNRTRVASIITVLEATVNDTNGNPVDIDGLNVEQDKPFALVNTVGSSWRVCVGDAVAAEGVSVPYGPLSGAKDSFILDGIRPGVGESLHVVAKIRICTIEDDIV